MSQPDTARDPRRRQRGPVKAAYPGPVLKQPDLERARGLIGVEERVAFIEDLMAEIRWKPTVIRRLSQLWGCAQDTVRGYSTEAHRRILANYRDDSEQVIARMCAAIDHAAQVALDKKRGIVGVDGKLRMVPDPDCRTVVEAQTRLAQILGLLPNRHELQIKYAEVNDEQLIKSVVHSTMASPRLRAILVTELRKVAPDLFAIEASGVPVLEENAREG